MTSNLENIKKRLSLYFMILVTSICFTAVGCGSNSNKSSEQEDLSDDDEYKDGTYCANVTYYNPNTGTNSTYTLNVEVEGKKLTKIYWSNGGWLDDSHFTPQEVDNGGTCSFTSDKGYQYTVEITGPECSSTSSGVALEGNDEPREFTLTYAQCASTIRMTEDELSQYEADFKIARTQIITGKMCDLMYEFIQKKRELDGKSNTLETMMDNGYIQKRYSTGTEDYVGCQTMIVKRKGSYYLMEVQGSRKATMGLMDFDPAISGWQEVKILEDPGKPVWQVFNIRIIDLSSEMTFLAEKMETFCTY